MDWIPYAQCALGTVTTAGVVWAFMARVNRMADDEPPRQIAIVGDGRGRLIDTGSVDDDPPQIAAAAPPKPRLAPPPGARVRPGIATELEKSLLLDDVVAELAKIPPLPRAIRGILKELNSGDSSTKTLARVVATEPVLTASILRLVNSAAMGLRRQIMTVDEAVTYLGFSTVKTLVVRLKLGQMMPRNKDLRGYNNEHLWLHSVAVAAAAEELAKRVGRIDPALAGTIGLLHDIGKVAINGTFPATVEKLFTRSQSANDDASFLERERRLFGADHAFIGAFLARKWELPAELAEAIRLHHMPHTPEALGMLSQTVRQAVCVVHLANQMVKYRHVYCESMEIDIVPDAVFRELGIEPDLDRLMDDRMRRTIESSVLTVTEPTAGAHHDRFKYRKAG